MKTDDLMGAKLDYWVALAEGYEYVDVPPDADGKNAGRALVPPGLLEGGWKFPPKGAVGNMVLPYSTNWERGGPIIERECILICACILREYGWTAFYGTPTDDEYADEDEGKGWFNGATPLIAAMRAYVARKFGEEVPDE